MAALNPFNQQEPQNLREQVAFLAGRNVVQEPNNVFLGLLTEFIRPQKALFAGIRELRMGRSLGDALSAFGGEFGSLFFSEDGEFDFKLGRLRRDVQFSDILDPVSTPEDRGTGIRALGLAGDLFLDPIRLSVFKKASHAIAGVGAGLASKGFARAEDINAIGPALTNLKNIFIPTGVPREMQERARELRNLRRQGIDVQDEYVQLQTEMSRANEAYDSMRDLRRRVEANESAMREGAWKSAKAYDTMAQEIGLPVEETRDLLLEQLNIAKLAAKSPTGTPRIPIAAGGQSLDKRFIDIATEYGFKEYDEWAGTAEELIVNSNAVRKAMMAGRLKDHELLLRNEVGEAGLQRLADTITEFKDNQLRRFVGETRDAKNAYAALQGKYAPGGFAPFESAEIEYILYSTTQQGQREMMARAFPDAVKDGLVWNTKHGSQLHSALKNHKLNKAEREFLGTTAERGLTIQQANQLSEAGKLRLFVGGRDVEFPHPFTLLETDPVMLETLRTARGMRSVEATKTFLHLVNEYGFVMTPKQMAVTRGQKVANRISSLEKKVAKGKADLSAMKMGKELATPMSQSRLTRWTRELKKAKQDLKDLKAKKLDDQALDAPALTSEAEEIIAAQDMVQLDKITGFERAFVPREVAAHIMKYHQTMNDPDALMGLIQNWTKAQSYWKAITIFPFLEYHTRNVVGNMFNMTLAGMDASFDLPLYTGISNSVLAERAAGSNAAIRLFANPTLKSLKGFTNKVDTDKQIFKFTKPVTINGEEVTEMAFSDVVKLVEEKGIARSGFYGTSEIATSLDRSVRAAQGRTTLGEKIFTVEGNAVLRGGMNVAGYLEDQSRVAMFLWGLDNGLDVDRAAKQTFKYLFDYSDLTDFEKRVFRGTLFPFYAWSRKNIPLQMEHMIYTPEKYSNFVKIKNAIESDIKAGEVPDDMFVSKFVRDGLNVRSRRRPNGDYEYKIMNNWWPAADLSELDSVEEIFGFIGNQISPFIKTAYEQVAGEFTFFDKEFTPERKDFAIFGNVPGIPQIGDRSIQLLRNIRFLSMIDRLFNFDAEDAMAMNKSNLAQRFMLGLNTVKQNTTLGQQYYVRNLRNEMNELRAAINRSMLRGDEEEAQRLIEQFQELVERQ